MASNADFFDYIFKFPDQGSYQRDPVVQAFAPTALVNTGGVQLLIYNPVETLNSPAAASNSLVLPPQQANSTVALAGFWAMFSLQGSPPSQLQLHPNLQILNDRTMMFNRLPSVIFTRVDITHINIVINIFGVYVSDGLQKVTAQGLLLEDGISFLQLEDGISNLLLEA